MNHNHQATLGPGRLLCDAFVPSQQVSKGLEPEYNHEPFLLQVLDQNPHETLDSHGLMAPSPEENSVMGERDALKDLSCFDVIDYNTDVDLLHAPVPMYSTVSPLGTTVNVFKECVNGTCSCSHFIGRVKSQLKPCRFAAIVFESDQEWAGKYVDLVWAMADGFPIVDEEFESYECENYSSITSAENKVRMEKILRRELAEGMVSFSENKPHCIHALGAVPKTNGGIRQITDCSRPLGISINNHCSTLLKDFCFKNVEDVVLLLEKGYYMSVVDIQAAYRAVPIREDHRKFQGFKWDWDGSETWFVDNRLCFGMSLGPSYFNYISYFIQEVLSKNYGLNVVNYLDDFIAVGETKEVCLCARGRMVSVLRTLGFHVSFDKLTFPSTCVTYLGIEIDSDRFELRLPEGKIEKLKSLLDYYSTKKRISKKNLESISGYLSHCSHVVKGGKMFCRSIYDLYKAMVVKNLQFININDDVRSDLAWWRNLCTFFNGSSRIVKDQYYLPMVSDSSMKGFAVYLGHDWVAGTWSDDDCIPLISNCQHISFRPVSDSFDSSNINELELWPVVVGLKRWKHVLRDKSLLLFTDNTQVMFMLRNSRSSNDTCRKWLKEIFWLCAIYNIDLTAQYINTKCNLVADTLSRLPYFKGINELYQCLYGSEMCCLNELFNIYRDK